MTNNELKASLQDKWSDIAIKAECQGLIHSAPRTGKTICALRIAQKEKAKKILVVYPDNKIKNSWINDVRIIDYQEDIIYTTYLSLHKHIDRYDIVYFDEIHDSSEAQRKVMKKLLKINK